MPLYSAAPSKSVDQKYGSFGSENWMRGCPVRYSTMADVPDFGAPTRNKFG
jgi:hypothetical protein